MLKLQAKVSSKFRITSLHIHHAHCRNTHLDHKHFLQHNTTMTKLICPFRGCWLPDFGVPQTHQTHVIQHLQDVHGVEVTTETAEQCRVLQNQEWQSRYEALEAERNARAKRMTENFHAFSTDPSQPLPT